MAKPPSTIPDFPQVSISSEALLLPPCVQYAVPPPRIPLPGMVPFFSPFLPLPLNWSPIFPSFKCSPLFLFLRSYLEVFFPPEVPPVCTFSALILTLCRIFPPRFFHPPVLLQRRFPPSLPGSSVFFPTIKLSPLPALWTRSPPFPWSLPFFPLTPFSPFFFVSSPQMSDPFPCFSFFPPLRLPLLFVTKVGFPPFFDSLRVADSLQGRLSGFDGFSFDLFFSAFHTYPVPVSRLESRFFFSWPVCGPYPTESFFPPF